MENEKWITAYEAFVDKMVAEEKVPGAAIGLAKDGELVYGKGVGYRNAGEQLEVTLDTVFGIGSITKSFTCMAIMQLQEAGKLSVHDPVIKYLPEFRLKVGDVVEQMTIHHLMTHSAGLPPMSTLGAALKRSIELDPEYEINEQDKYSLAKIVPVDTYAEMFDYMAEQDFELLGTPGTEFSYSNESYAMLGVIIERVSGKSYEAYMKEHILVPAGMNNSVFLLDELDESATITSIYAAKTKDGEKEVFLSDNWWDAPAMRAAGFLKSTVRDMLKYADIYRTGGLAGSVRILTEDSVKQMVTPYIQCEQGCYYGYGLMITPDYHGTLLVEHGGSIKGVQAQMHVLPEKGVTGIVLTNLTASPATALMNGALNAFADRAVDASHMPEADHEVPADRVEEFTGEYHSNEGSKLAIIHEDGAFKLVTEDNQSMLMKPIGEDLFLVKRRGSAATIRYIRDNNNNVIRISFGFRQIPKAAKPQPV